MSDPKELLVDGLRRADDLDDLTRKRMWSRLEDRLAADAKPAAGASSARGKYIAIGAAAVAFAATLAVIVLARHRDEPAVAATKASRSVVAAESTLTTKLGPHAHASIVGPAEYAFVGAPGDVTEVALAKGTLVAEFEGGTGRSLEISAPNMTVEIIGTLFAVDVDATRTCVSVSHGRVRATTPAGIVFVGAGERACSDTPPIAPLAIEPRVRALLDTFATPETADTTQPTASPDPRTSETRTTDTQRAADPQTADNRTSDMRTADSRTTDTRSAADPQTTDNQTSDNRTTDTRSAADSRTADNRTADNRTADNRTTDERTAGNRTTDERTTTDPRTVDNRTADRRTPDERTTTDPRTADTRTTRTAGNRTTDTRAADPRTAENRTTDTRTTTDPRTAEQRTTETRTTGSPIVDPFAGSAAQPAKEVDTHVEKPAAEVARDEALYRAAEAALARRDPVAADRALAELVTTQPHSPLVDQAIFERARIAYQRHAWGEARRQLAALAALTTSPLAESGRYLGCRIAVDTHDGDATRCLVDFRAAYPRSAHDLDALATLAQLATDCKVAHPYVVELAARYPRSAAAHAWQEHCK